MAIAEHIHDGARPSEADDVEPLWHVKLPAGIVIMTLDELDAAFQEGFITERTLVAREDEKSLRPLGVVAGLFEPTQPAAPGTQSPWERRAHVSGVRPLGYAQQQLPEPAHSSPSAWTILERQGQAQPSLAGEGISSWESAPVRWLRNARAVVRLTARRPVSWFWAHTPRQRWTFISVVAAALTTAIGLLWPTAMRSPEPVMSDATAPTFPLVARAAYPVSEQRSLGAGSAPAAALPSRGREPPVELDLPNAGAASHHAPALGGRLRAALGQGRERPLRKSKARRRRASRH